MQNKMKESRKVLKFTPHEIFCLFECPGASSGIGAATAVLFSKLGATLALTGRKADNLNKVASQCEEASGGKKVQGAAANVRHLYTRL